MSVKRLSVCAALMTACVLSAPTITLATPNTIPGAENTSSLIAADVTVEEPPSAPAAINQSVVSSKQLIESSNLAVQSTDNSTATASKADVAIGTVEAIPGQTIRIPVSVSYANSGIFGLSMNLHYDPTLITINRAIPTSALTESTHSTDFFQYGFENGCYRIGWDSLNPVYANGQAMFEIEATLSESAQAGSMASITGSEAYGANDEQSSIGITFQNGGITVKASQSSDFLFTEDGNGMAITGTTSSSSSLTIPSTINGRTVVSIASNAFNGNTQLTSVSLPASVSSIGQGAFLGCTNLVSVNIPNQSALSSIADSAFFGCSKLKTISLPSPLSSLGAACFMQCYQLSSITVPSQITTIPDRCFSGCALLQTVSFDSNSQLGSIGSCAFQNCTSLAYLDLPSGTMTAQEDSFIQTANPLVLNAKSKEQCETIAEKLSWMLQDGTLILWLNGANYPSELTSISNLADITIPANARWSNGSAVPSVQIKDQGELLVKDVDYTLTCANNTTLGTASATITGIGAYTGQIKFTYEVLSPSGYSACDLDGNGAITIKDQILLHRIVAGTTKPSNEEALLGDVNRDGAVNEMDLDAITERIMD